MSVITTQVVRTASAKEAGQSHTLPRASHRDLVAYCEDAYGDPSYELSVALRDHTEVL
jgi:hypothetical protein